MAAREHMCPLPGTSCAAQPEPMPAVLTPKVGDELEVKGPIPKFAYESNMKKNIGK